jgi:hypothetical protein
MFATRIHTNIPTSFDISVALSIGRHVTYRKPLNGFSWNSVLKLHIKPTHRYAVRQKYCGLKIETHRTNEWSLNYFANINNLTFCFMQLSSHCIISLLELFAQWARRAKLGWQRFIYSCVLECYFYSAWTLLLHILLSSIKSIRLFVVSCNGFQHFDRQLIFYSNIIIWR